VCILLIQFVSKLANKNSHIMEILVGEIIPGQNSTDYIRDIGDSGKTINLDGWILMTRHWR